MPQCCSKTWVKFFKAICDGQRHKILALIHQHDQMNESEIVKKMKLSQPTVSHHLKILCEAGVISVQKKGKERFYTLRQKQVNECCMGFAKWFSHAGKKEE